MHFCRLLKAVALGFSIALIAGCETAPPPPTLALSADVVGGRKSRAAKMRAAKIKPLSAGAAQAYMAELDRELRIQTAGMGLDVLEVGSGIVIRIPAELTFGTGSAGVRPEFDATLLEIARTEERVAPAEDDLFRFARALDASEPLRVVPLAVNNTSREKSTSESLGRSP